MCDFHEEIYFHINVEAEQLSWRLTFKRTAYVSQTYNSRYFNIVLYDMSRCSLRRPRHCSSQCRGLPVYMSSLSEPSFDRSLPYLGSRGNRALYCSKWAADNCMRTLQTRLLSLPTWASIPSLYTTSTGPWLVRWYRRLCGGRVFLDDIGTRGWLSVHSWRSPTYFLSEEGTQVTLAAEKAAFNIQSDWQDML